jgi:hypothetical protein
MASQGAQAGGSMLSTLADSPVLLGALGLAAGALLGVLIPQSEQEEALLGGVAGQARAAASGLASEGMERGQRIARTIADKAQESAQAHGLAGDKSVGEMVDAALQGELAGHAGDVAREVLQSGQEALRKEASSSAKPDPQGSATPSESRRS